MNLVKRPRRLRMNSILREMIRETSLDVGDLIYPLFVVPGDNIKEEINSMPGVYHFSIDLLIEEVKEVRDLGIPAIYFLVCLHIKMNWGQRLTARKVLFKKP